MAEVEDARKRVAEASRVKIRRLEAKSPKALASRKQYDKKK